VVKKKKRLKNPVKTTYQEYLSNDPMVKTITENCSTPGKGLGIRFGDQAQSRQLSVEVNGMIVPLFFLGSVMVLTKGISKPEIRPMGGSVC
jgi:hypothetical protein